METKTLADRFTYSKEWSIIELNDAEKRYDNLLERRNRARERLIVGGMAINAASITGVFAALSSGSEILDSLGITNYISLNTILMFSAGAVLSVIAHWLEDIVLVRWSSEQFQRLSLLRQRQSLLQVEDTSGGALSYQKLQSEIDKKPPQDFKFSWLSTALVNGSGSLWLGGVANLIYPAVMHQFS
ncbi:MAG: hypothetical protein ACKOQ3_00620 [Novosphingobium sp.]